VAPYVGERARVGQVTTHRYPIVVTVRSATEGGRADAEALSDAVYEALVDAIEDITIDGIADHATKDDEVEWTAEVTGVSLGDGE